MEKEQYVSLETSQLLKEKGFNIPSDTSDEGQQPIGDTNAIYGTKSLLYYLRKGMEE